MIERFDYIVIGAGSAGCALANRLSANPAHSVLLVESGPPDTSLFISMPRGLGLINNPGSKYIWEYDVATGDNRPRERWFRGRTLGGSSATNGMVYMRGAPRDYNGWADMGCSGWGWSDVVAKFVELENHELGATESRGGQGPLKIARHVQGDALFEAILDAAQELGTARVEDVNGPNAVRDGGVGYQPSTLYRGRRFSAARAFLHPVRGRRNLHVATATDALKITFDGRRASGVTVRDKSGIRSVQADREIILSAGAFETPKLLQRSGIGPAPLLFSLGIDVVVDSPLVGRNLLEHRHVDLALQVRGNSQNPDLGGARAIWSMLRYVLARQGPMSHGAHEVGGFVKSEPDLDHADLQFGLMSLSASSTGKNGAVALDKFPGVTFITYFTRPESQGEVRITSPIQTLPPSSTSIICRRRSTAENSSRRFVGTGGWPHSPR